MQLWRYVIPGAVLIGILGYTLGTVGHGSLTHPPDITASRNIPMQAPPASAPLIQREKWIMQFATARVRHQWGKWGRPPLYSSHALLCHQHPRGISGGYYFEHPGVGRNHTPGVPVRFSHHLTPQQERAWINSPAWADCPLKP